MNTFDPANLLGAASVAVIDAMSGVTNVVIGHGGETAAALVAIGHQPGLSNDGLRQVLGLSHPGTVRLVDRLTQAGLIERRQAVDRRAIALHMTPAGLVRRTALLARRQEVLSSMLAPLDDTERATLGELLARMLECLPRSPLHGLSICRLCDNEHCMDCPVNAGIDRICLERDREPCQSMIALGDQARAGGEQARAGGGMSEACESRG